MPAIYQNTRAPEGKEGEKMANSRYSRRARARRQRQIKMAATAAAALIVVTLIVVLIVNGTRKPDRTTMAQTAANATAAPEIAVSEDGTANDGTNAPASDGTPADAANTLTSDGTPADATDALTPDGTPADATTAPDGTISDGMNVSAPDDSTADGTNALSPATATLDSTSSTAAARALTRPAAKGNNLPVFSKADTQEKIIAITVDDCFQASNLRTIVQTAIDNGAKLTIFPIGEVALREKQTEILKWAWDNGMELENHTFTHNGLYNASDELLAKEIYYQNLALSKILGVEYHAHFLRPKGGDARNDERMHAYARQMGYYGIAHWTISGSGSTPSKLASTLAPGNIYLFHTTDQNDFEKLCGFIPYAVSQGYTLVTLNEMFGYPDNETEPLTTPIEEHQPPALEPYQITLIPLEKGSYDYRVYRLQEKLKALGCTKDDPDGIYGKDTVEAVKKFQKKAGLEVTGKADVATQEKAFGM